MTATREPTRPFPAWIARWSAPGERRRLLQLLAALVVVGGAFALGEWRGRQNAMGLPDGERQLQERISTLETDNRETHEQLARLQTDARIDRETYAQVEAQLTDLQGKIIEQQEELAFYRGIVGGPGKGGLQVQDFSLTTLPASGVRLRFVLARVEGAGQYVRGEVQVRVEGLRDGRVVSIDLASLANGPAARSLPFNFRYFQDMEAEIRLPGGFTPQRVVVRIVPRTGGMKPSVESFPWSPRGP
jgi:hypothetical protein